MLSRGCGFSRSACPLLHQRFLAWQSTPFKDLKPAQLLAGALLSSFRQLMHGNRTGKQLAGNVQPATGVKACQQGVCTHRNHLHQVLNDAAHKML